MSEITDLLDEFDMESWLEHEGVQFKLTRGKSGIQAHIKECPSCGDSKWKVYFGLESGYGNCFICDTRFTKWSFVSAFHGNLTNGQVFDEISSFAKQYGYSPAEPSLPVIASPSKELQLPASIPIPYNGQNLKYLSDRGIPLSIAEEFDLRYCRDGWYNYVGVDGNRTGQCYSKRLLIPIYNEGKQLVTFQGRDITGEKQPKYLFPPGLASTGSYIYHAHQAFDSEVICLGEGVFDCFAIRLALDRQIAAGATFGKKLSSGDEQSQANKLLRLKREGKLKEVVLMWDAEKSALRAAIEAAATLRSYGLVAKVAVLPKGRDPNEVDASEVRKAFDEALVADASFATRLKLKLNSWKE